MLRKTLPTAIGVAAATLPCLLVTAAAAADPLAAPTLTVSGQTLKWNAVSGVSSFVFVRKVPGQSDAYSIVTGTSITPPAVAGTTVKYGLRTNVSGSAWASEVSIAYPSTPPPPPPPTGKLSFGLAGGSVPSYEVSFDKSLGAHTARVEFAIGTSSASMRTTVDAYAKAGIRPLLLATFYGRIPSTAEAQNLASWAKEFGPGGTFWAGKTYPANTAVTDIEFGNETSYSYQFPDTNGKSGFSQLASYKARAQQYALRVKDAQLAIQAVNPKVGVLAIGDPSGGGSSWVDNMFLAVPDLGQRVAGWTIHPYGPTWQARLDQTISTTAARGAPSTVPLWITEWGLATDNGRCLSDNYGYNKCMSYAEAATTLHSVLSGMRTRYGSRLGAFYLFQDRDQKATGTYSGREGYFGAVQVAGQAKGAYTTEVKADLAANP